MTIPKKIQCTITGRNLNQPNDNSQLKVVVYKDGSKEMVQQDYNNMFTSYSIFNNLSNISRLDGNMSDLSMKDLEIASQKSGYEKILGTIKIDKQNGVATARIGDYFVKFDFGSAAERKNVSQLKPSENSVEIIKKHESYRSKAYQCPSGVWTIGYGHTKGVRKGQTITRAQGEAYFQQDLQNAVNIVRKYVKVPLTQNEFDALVSFVFNVGEGNFKNSTMLKKINAREYEAAAAEFPKWNKGDGKVLQGLVTRRREEKGLFEKRIA